MTVLEDHCKVALNNASCMVYDAHHHKAVAFLSLKKIFFLRLEQTDLLKYAAKGSSGQDRRGLLRLYLMLHCYFISLCLFYFFSI